jgi:molybdopterin-guanine dinucleotide biosynthesis protein A
MDSSKWTAVIPCAGKGSRLGFEPKILYQIDGRPVLSYIVDLLEPFCSKLVFVCNSRTWRQVDAALVKLLPRDRWFIALQYTQNGMADAVRCGLAFVYTPNVLVLWGDKATVRPATIETLMTLHSVATIAAAVCEKPYTHLIVENEMLVGVLEQRQGHVLPLHGLSDIGLFLFQSDPLKMYLDSGKVPMSREWDLLPLLPHIPCVRVATIASQEEALSLNTKEDAQRICDVISSYSQAVAEQLR